MPAQKRVCCPICKKSFNVLEKFTNFFCIYCETPLFECPLCKAILDAKAKVCTNCGVEFAEEEPTFRCPVCDAIVSESAEFCSNCQTQFVGEEVQIKEKDLETAVCSVCGKNLKNLDDAFKCTSCSKYVCGSCSISELPAIYQLKAKIVYDYKLKFESRWNRDTARFAEAIPQNLCANCYDDEFAKAVKRLQLKIKNWKIDMAREGDIKIIEETFPPTVSPPKQKQKVGKELLKIFKK
jgi:hypothetical protein